MGTALMVAFEVGLCWAATVKVAHLRRSPDNKPLRAVVGLCLCLALGSLLTVPGLNGLAENALPGLPKLLLNVFTVTGTYCLMAFYGYSVGGEKTTAALRRRLAGLFVTLAVMTASWVGAPEHIRVAPAALEHLHERPSAIFTVAALGYMGFGLGHAFRWSVHYARAAPGTRLRTSLRIVSVALAGLLTACLIKAGLALALGLLENLATDDPVVRGLYITCAGLVLTGTLLMVTGFCYPALSSAPARFRRRREQRRIYRRLGPLWHRIRAAFPHLVLTSGVPGLAGGRVPWTYRDYYRRVVEIRDGLVQLAPYYDPGTAARLKLPDEPDGEAEIRLRAVLTVDALRRKHQERPVENPYLLTPLGGDDLDSDARWLARLAAAMDQESSAPLSSSTSSMRST